ncbi:uncharacterized protein FIBRA_02065 [Fibroporia radiculosa]|uniref:NADP-dependent oxidoreductase domain-containing protein n=1 Tax=Fibroporia radiculosa TaxID=599839 RepID=J4H1M6_9APHY|nr:uncharacterized protein FIBRA_02065 [Fibroporia radiculosa]CCM00039.1 predicted protein [Fibroporia radiculosa]
MCDALASPAIYSVAQMLGSSLPVSQIPVRTPEAKSRVASNGTPVKGKSRLPIPSGTRPGRRHTFGEVGNSLSGDCTDVITPGVSRATAQLKSGLVPASRTYGTPGRIRHTRQRSIPKSPKAVFRSSLDQAFVFPVLSETPRSIPNAVPRCAKPYVRSKVRTSLSPSKPPQMSSSVPPTASIPLELNISNPASVCIPTAPSVHPLGKPLLIPTPSFLAVQKSDSFISTRSLPRSVTLRSSLTYRPAPAQSSLLLATPSFAAMKTSKSNTTILSFLGAQNTRLDASMRCTNPLGRSLGETIEEAGQAQTIPVATPGANSDEARQKNNILPMQSLSMPQDMMDTLQSLENIAVTIRNLPRPELPTLVEGVALAADPHGSTPQEAISSCAYLQSEEHVAIRTTTDLSRIKDKPNFSLPFRAACITHDRSAADSHYEMPSQVESTEIIKPVCTSKPPRVRRISIGRVISIHVPAAKSKIPSLPVTPRAASAGARDATNKASPPSRLPTLGPPPKRRQNIFKSVLRSRHSDPPMPTKSLEELTPRSNVAKRMRATIPSVAFGTWKLGGGQSATTHVDQALSVGFNHVDTAQSYRNELEAGTAIRESGLAREDLFITTKYSGMADIDVSIHNSLDYLGLEYVDLYLIHNPRLAVPDIPTIWSRMEKIQEAGLTKSIGVSNFNVPQLETLLASAKIKPVANQILFHPYVLNSQMPIVEYGNQNGIVSEAYSVLIPLTSQPGGPVDKPVQDIATRLNAKPEQVLLAWAKAKGVVVVTASTKRERLEGYLAAGDLELTDEDIASIDAAGSQGERRLTARTFLRRAAIAALVGAGVLGACSYLGIHIL